MRNSAKARRAPRCEDRLAIDLKGMEARIAAGGALFVFWRIPAGARHQAQLYIEDNGLRIEYGLGDRDGRWTQSLGTEFAPWHMMPLHLGGFRRWLGCPGCGRRCRSLYYGEAVLRCRRCLGLKYRSQDMQPAQRASYGMYRLRKYRLDDQSPDLLDGCPPKPRGMRWKTYERLAAIDEALEERRLGLILGSAVGRSRAQKPS
jgi:hypothetical protein